MNMMATDLLTAALYAASSCILSSIYVRDWNSGRKFRSAISFALSCAMAYMTGSAIATPIMGVALRLAISPVTEIRRTTWFPDGTAELMRQSRSAYTDEFWALLDGVRLGYVMSNDPEIDVGGATCFTVSPSAQPVGGTAIIAIVEPDWTADQRLGRLHDCLPHEIGHIVDYRDSPGRRRVSDLQEFRTCVERTVAEWKSGTTNKPWSGNAQMLATFPGLFDNQTSGKIAGSSNWGGYGEAFPELFGTSLSLDDIPPCARDLYAPYLKAMPDE